MSQELKSDLERVKEIIKGISFAMVTTVDNESGELKSRPLTLQETEFDGDLWFFVGRSTPPVNDVFDNSKVNVAFSDVKKNSYVSLSGQGQVVFDKEKAKELWNPALKAWFPKGVDDPELCLLKIHVESADYWESPNSKVVQLVGFAKAILTGTPARGLGEHGHVKLNS